MERFLLRMKNCQEKHVPEIKQKYPCREYVSWQLTSRRVVIYSRQLFLPGILKYGIKMAQIAIIAFKY